MADPDITTAMSALVVSEAHPSPPPRPNFPLPRELCDQIYGYLLDNKYTRVKRTYDLDSDQANSEHGLTAYHFHTNIWPVNRAIHAEAEKQLYERNVFVVVSYQSTNLGLAIRSNRYVPVVSTEHVARMKHHSLRVHFNEGNFMTQQAGKIDSAILLVNQMGSLCKMLGQRLAGCPPRSVLVDMIPLTSTPTIRGRPVHIAFALKSPKIICEVRNTHFRAMDRKLQTRLLSPLASAVSDSLVVSFRGDICNIEETAELQKTMRPSLASFDAKCWARYESRSSLQDLALEALQHDELDVAMAMYDELCDGLQDVLDGLVLGEGERIQCSRVFQAMLLQDAQVTLSLAWLWLKTLDYEYMLAIGTKIDLFAGNLGQRQVFDNFPLEVKAYASHLSVLLNIYVCQLAGKARCKTIGEVDDQLASFGDGFPHIAHDRAILARTTDRTTAFTKAHLPFEHCSVSVMSVPEFSRCGESDILKTPEHFVGWQNKNMILSLDNKTRREINRIQAAHGLEKTDFSEY